MRPLTHFGIVAIGLSAPWVVQMLAEAPRLPLQVLAGLGVAAVLDRAVRVLVIFEVRARSPRTSGVGAPI